MNILTSYNWIKEYLDTKLSPEAFAELTTASGNSVEVTDRVAERFEHMVVGDVLELGDHPDADKLKVAKVDIGKKRVDIVCGGANLVEGQKVVVGLPGAKVRWHGEGDFVELKETKIRGVSSYGMICAVEEIGFDKLANSECPTDIWDISTLTDAKAGTPIAEALGLDDVIFDIEVTSNRPDCKSIIGQAREGAAVTKDRFAWKPGEPKGTSSDAGFSVTVKEKELCPRYTAVVIDGITVGPSPWWMQSRLLLAGFKPINNLVDITNYILHEYGQPLHTFDADMLEGSEIVVRRAKKGEKFVALDKETYELSDDMLVIADKDKPVAVAGVMGGLETGTTQQTTKVVIECAMFDPVQVRRTARALNLYSDSQLLFEKGLSTQALGPALARAIELIKEVAGGEVVSKIFDERSSAYKPFSFAYDEGAVNRLMGIEMSRKDQVGILERLGFEVGKDSVKVPYWRDHDIEASVDFVEEIARVYGYANFPSRLPSGELPKAVEDNGLVWERRTKQILSGAGLCESYSYSFVSRAQLENYGLDPDKAVHIRNPLSVEHEYLRTSLVPSLLSSIEENQARIPSADMFEIAPVYLAKKHDIPDQEYRLVIGCYGRDGIELFSHAKGILERFLRQTGIRDWSLDRDTDPTRWHQGRSATVKLGKTSMGTIGQVSRQVAESFGIDVEVVLVELDFETLLDSFTLVKAFEQVSLYPAVKRDLAFAVLERTEAAQIEEVARKASDLLVQWNLFDLYRGKGVDEGYKSMAVHLSFRAQDRTLEASEVDEELVKISRVLEKEFKATMRS
jgi:phenylalanyl-tRNA synthetase beta chain